MTTKRLRSILILTGLTLALGACGKSRGTLPNYYNLPAGQFGVIMVDPGNRTTAVLPSTQIQVRFSEAVNPDSITGNFSFTETSGQTTVDKTSSLILQKPLSNGNQVAVFTPSKYLDRPADYRFTLTTGVTSASGKAMVGSFDLIFSTGDGFSQGYNSDPANPPTPQDAQIVFDNSGNPYVMVTFNEDLSRAPNGLVEINGGLPFIGSTGLLTFTVAYQGQADIWVAPFGQYCGEIVGTVKIKNAVDLTGTRQVGEKTFDIWFGC